MKTSTKKFKRKLEVAATIGSEIAIFLAGFSVTVLVLVLAEAKPPVIYRSSFFLTLLFLLLTTVFMFFTFECFLRLSQATSEQEERFWADAGSILYGPGTCWLLLAVALLLLLMTPFPFLAYFLLVSALIGFYIYHKFRTRWRNQKKEHVSIKRAIAGGMMFIQLLVGLFIAFLTHMRLI